MMSWVDTIRTTRINWQFQPQQTQHLWLAVVVMLVLLGANAVLQLVFAVGVEVFILGADGAKLLQGHINNLDEFAKASMIGLLPASLAVIGLAFYCARFGKAGERADLLLHWPGVGLGRLVLIVILFAALMYFFMFASFTILGIDPQSYAPSADGFSQDASRAGLVEKALADLADEPMLFALAVPGVIFAVPIAEELIFRGAIFSALAASPVGRMGAVVITAALWSLAHSVSAPWLFVAMLFAMGLLLGLLLLKFGSLWIPIACHSVWNALSSLVLFGTSQ
jgi:membrane protease YdiL (CAAX protease family)